MTVRSDIGADGLSPRLGLLVLQPTPFCNIDCSYCYLSDRRSTARMSLETLALACRRVFETRIWVGSSRWRGTAGSRSPSRSPGMRRRSRMSPSIARRCCSSRIVFRPTACC